MFCVVAVVFFVANEVIGTEPRPSVITENGIVVGTHETSYSGAPYRAFKGIPYAEPPVGNNRFKEAQRLEKKWTGEWQATEYGSACLQLDQFGDVAGEFSIRGEEDCLFLNVFTPTGGSKKKNVVFTIHGGAFMFGSSFLYGPKYMMDRDDIVYVTINYRLGPLGFLTTGDGVVPGNNGLKDQLVALQWVNRNIANFDGDPDKLTIIGLSAGGASVDYFFLTSLSKGLFQRGISFSGSALSPWALVKNGPERTRKLAQGLGCPDADSKALVKCLRRRPARQIVNEVRSLLAWHYNPFTVFGPVVEVNSSRPFIDRTPEEIHRLGLGQQLPWIGGVTTEDGLYPAAEFVERDDLIKEINDNWLKIGDALLFLDPSLPEAAKEESLLKAKLNYFGDKSISRSNVFNLVKLLTDRLYAAGLVETALNRAGARLYQYGYKSAISVSHALTGGTKSYGACHGDDVSHLIDFSFGPSHTTPNDIKMAEVMKDIVFTFVKNGEVSKKYNWEPISVSNSHLKIMSPDDITISRGGIVDIEAYKNIFDGSASARDEL